MFRLFLILIIVTALSFGIAWIADEPGRVVIDWASYHMETSLPVILGGTALLALLCMIIYFLLFALVRTPRNLMRTRLAKRQSLGLAALTEAFAAIATQDVGTARRQIARAQQYLPHQPLTLMLSAQAARMEGNESQARLYLEQMLKAEGTEFMALRGLIENARRSRDDDTALRYAEKAITVKPQDVWLITMLAGLYARQGRTQNALHLLEQSARKRYIGKPDLRRLSAYVLTENAHALTEQKRFDFAIAVLEDVLRRQPGFAPAGAMLADAYLRQHDLRRALKTIAGCWKIMPHPELTQALLACYDAEDDHKKTLQMAQKLARSHPEHRESQFLTASIALREGTYAAARTTLQHLARDRETVRTCTLLAETENAAEDREQASHWLKHAASAEPDPAWTCDNCRQPMETWRLTCSHCGSVATLAWK